MQHVILTDADRGDGVDQAAEQLDVDLAGDIVEAVGSVGIQPLAKKAERLRVRLYQLLHEHPHGAGPVLADAEPFVDVVRAYAVEFAVLQYVAPDLIQCDLQSGALFVEAEHIADVELIAQDAERRDVEARLQRRGAQGLVIRDAGDVSRDAALRIAAAVAFLDMRAAQRVGVVARPDLREEAQDPEIEATAARGAALKEDVRKAEGQRAHDLV